MSMILALHNRIFSLIERLGGALMPLLARFVFAATLLVYYWNSGLTKLGDGLFGVVSPSVGAYAQIFPRQFEAVGYDASQLSVLHWAVVMAGTWAEFLLPLLIVLGLGTRLASLGMIGFIVMQSLTDIVGHHADAATVGAWFDRLPDAVVLDQRAFWVFLLLLLVVRGGGFLSLDAALRGRGAGPV